MKGKHPTPSQVSASMPDLLPPRIPNVLHSTAIVSGGTLLSRLLGFTRDACIAWILGGTGTADALTVALRLPYMMRRLFGEGTLSLSLTVAFVREGMSGGSNLAMALGRKVLPLAAVGTLLAILGAELLIPITAPGLLARQEVLTEAVHLFRLCIPYAAFAVLAAISMAELHSRGHFLLPSLMPVLFNIIVLCSVALAMGRPVPQCGMILAVGVLCGGFIQWFFLLAAGGRLHGRVRRRESLPPKAHIRTILCSLPAGIFGAAVPQLAFLIAAVLYSLLPEGHLAALFYAERLLEFPLCVLGAATGMAAVPRLAAAVAQNPPLPVDTAIHGDTIIPAPFMHELNRAQYLSLGLNIPAAAGLAAVAVPLVALVFNHGAFESNAVQATALALYAYAPALPAYALSRPLLAACQALQDRSTPMLAAIASLSVAFISGLTLMQINGPWGPPLGVSLGLWCNVWLLRRGLGVCAPHLPLRSLAWMLLGAACAYAAATWVATACTTHSPIFTLGLAIPAGAVTYAVLLLAGDKAMLINLFHTTRR